MGKISGLFGVKGWLKVFSYTETKENILHYSPWLLSKNGAQQTVRVTDSAVHGKLLIVLLDGINDRETAATLVGSDIFIAPEQLPKPQPGEYYWSDLVGLTVETDSGIDLGLVAGLMETGANDVLIVRGERDRAIPFLQGRNILKIDFETGKITVDWDPDF